MHACARGADEVVRVLVDFSASIDARNWDGDTALQISQRRRDPPDVVAVTKDILLDGIMTADEPAKGGAVKAHGHMMVSVLEAGARCFELHKLICHIHEQYHMFISRYSRYIIYIKS